MSVAAGYELGELVAERNLEIVDEAGGRKPVTVKLGRPLPDPLPGGDWYCPFQIVGLGEGAVRAAFGVDSLQAFLLAVYGVRLHLTERAAAAAVRLSWLGQESFLGLAVEPDIDVSQFNL